MRHAWVSLSHFQTAHEERLINPTSQGSELRARDGGLAMGIQCLASD